MTRRHLAIFLPSLHAGGAEQVMLALAEQFVRRGVRCDLVVATAEGRLLDKVPANVRLVSLDRRKPVHATFALACYLRRERPQTLLSTVLSANLTALLATMLAVRPLRHVLREANQTELDVQSTSRVRTVINRAAVDLLYRRADAVIAVAKSVREGLVKLRVVPPSRIHDIRNPVLPRISANTSIARVKQLVVACGRLEYQKDHHTLLRAFAKVRERIDAKLVLIGDGSLRSSLRDSAAGLGIVDSVSFTGFDAEPWRWMQKASVFVHPSRFEGMSNVLIEALACGCPVVATDCPGGTREILADGKYGILVPVGDAEAVATAIVQILSGDVRLPDASEHLRTCNIDAVTDAYLDVLFPNWGAGN